MMKKPFELHGVEAEKAEAMKRYNNRRSFINILRVTAVVLICYLWFPMATISLKAVGGWFQRTGVVIITNRSVVFVFANILVALIFLLSRDRDNENNSNIVELDLYDHYTSSSAVVVTGSAEKVEDDVSNKQIVPVFITEGEEDVVVEAEAVRTDVKATFRRTKSENKKKNSRPVTEFRRTESAKVVPMERLSSEEFRLKVERFIMEKKMRLVQENEVVKAKII